jgi:hypothetical protein
LTFKNKGGLLSPLIIQFVFADGTEEIKRIPVEIWRYNYETVSKVFPFKKEVKQIVLDPYLETADVNMSNNVFPPENQPTRFQLYKGGVPSKWDSGGDNPMQRAKQKK